MKIERIPTAPKDGETLGEYAVHKIENFTGHALVNYIGLVDGIDPNGEIIGTAIADGDPDNDIQLALSNEGESPRYFMASKGLSICYSGPRKTLSVRYLIQEAGYIEIILSAPDQLSIGH